MPSHDSSEHRKPASERYSIAIITLVEEMFREMRGLFLPAFA